MLCCILDSTEGSGTGMLPDWGVPDLRSSWTWMLQPWSAHHSLECRGFPGNGVKEELFQLFQSWLSPDGMGMLCCIPGSPEGSGAQHWDAPTGMLLQQLQQPPEPPFPIPVRFSSFSRREMELFSPRICPCGSGHRAVPGMPPGQRHGKKNLGKSFEAKLRKSFATKLTPLEQGPKTGFPLVFHCSNPLLLTPTPELELALLAPGSQNPDSRRST